VRAKYPKSVLLFDFAEYDLELALEEPRKEATAVTQQAVERALGKLLTDENFRGRFFSRPSLDPDRREAGRAERTR